MFSKRFVSAWPVLSLLFGLLAESPAVALPQERKARSSGELNAPNLLLITVDTLRPDALGWIAHANQTPAIDDLAREGFRFPAAVSPVPLTLPAHASILTGLLPRRHGLRVNGQVLEGSIPTLATILRARGYSTGAFISGYPLQAVFGLNQGFQKYDDQLTVLQREGLERNAEQTTAAAIAWLRQASSPWFAWIHYYDPHDPYLPPPAFQHPGLRGNYDGEVAYTDTAIGHLREAITKSNRPVLTVFTADHAESLGEHRERTHGYFIYDTTTVVPLIVHFPGTVAPGESMTSARLIDIVPTVLDLFKMPARADIDGISLAPTLNQRPQNIPASFLECRQPLVSYGWAPLSGIRDKGWKFISAPRPELYDLTKDPGELENLASREGKKLLALKSEFDRVTRGPEAQADAIADPEALRKLRSLGYLGGGAAVREVPRDLADPKDRVAQREALSAAEAALAKGDSRAALEQFEAVLAIDPNNRFALLQSGVAFFRLGDLRSAVPRLEKAVALAAEDPQAHFTVADIFSQAGQDVRAIPHWMEAIRLQPRATGAWLRLGQSLLAEGKNQEAFEAYRRAAELDPKNSFLLRSVALAELRAGNKTAALGHFQQAAATAPEGTFADSGTLGLLLLESGKPGQARPWLRRCRQGEPDCAEARFRLARLELKAGNVEAARAMLREALVFDPSLRERAASDGDLGPLQR